MFLGPHGPQREWKSNAADQLRRMGLGDQAEALYGVEKQASPLEEMTSAQLREEGKRRAAQRKARPKSRLAKAAGVVQPLILGLRR
ncbi:MAG: hypothetical protein OXL97_14355 [Chloroflexota bacterium]|nr:hypothetical protein [Chloroflexota bacterium]MDE2883744.1 hypothetical protein [Chloroflexota bacterium]